MLLANKKVAEFIGKQSPKKTFSVTTDKCYEENKKLKKFSKHIWI